MEFPASASRWHVSFLQEREGDLGLTLGIPAGAIDLVLLECILQVSLISKVGDFLLYN